MPFARPGFTSLMQQARQDLSSGVSRLGTLLPVSLVGTLAKIQAGFAQLHFDYLDWISKQSVPFTCTDEYLEAWANLKGIQRKPATRAGGVALFQGVPGSVIPAGTEVVRADGWVYRTSQEVLFHSTSALVPISSVEMGDGGNAASGVVLMLSTLSPGVQSEGVAQEPIVGGSEVERDEDLRERMLMRYSAPPQGGSRKDYVEWALSVPGVTRAWCKPGLDTSGSLVVYVMLDEARQSNQGFPQGANGVSAQDPRGPTATGDLLLVANYIEERRPVTSLVYVSAPLPHNVGVEIRGLSNNTLAVREAIKQNLAGALVNIGTPLGMTLYQSTINAAIEQAVPQGTTWTLITPSAPVSIALGRLPVPQVTFS